MGAGGGGNTSGGLVQIIPNENVVDIVEAAMDDETSDDGKAPIALPDENAIQNMAPLRGRTWTSAHNKALLYVVRDEDCCFLEKRTNSDKSNAWKLFEERLKGTYPKLFGSWVLDRKQIRKRILALLKAHRANEEGVLRATGRGGGMVDEELAQLCDEVTERVSDAETRKGAAHAEKARAREMKERNGEMLVMSQLQTGGKRTRLDAPSNSSPDESRQRTNSRRRRTSGDENRGLVLPELQKSLVALLRSQERRDALDEWRVRCEAHRNDPLRHVDPGSLDDWMNVYLNTHGQGTSVHMQPSTSQRDEDEVESPNKDTRGARFK
eukprot:scaffold424_cov325-Pavlova_lutheri.AAC.2